MDHTVSNLILSEMNNEISSIYTHDFGSSMLHCDTDDLEGILQRHRIATKFEQPSASNERKLEDACFESWINRDQSRRPFDKLKAHPVVWKARILLHQWFRDFRPSSDIVEFTPGETYFSLHGRCSIYQKLRNRASWTITYDAFEDFARLCYNTLMLKRCAKAHFRKRNKLEERRLYMYYHLKGVKHIGYAIFRHKLESDVVTWVRGSRASSVPKNNDKRRFINVEPFLNMILQRQVAASIRRILETCNNSLDTGQDDHRKLIIDPNVATIDFENASDSVFLDVVNFMFPPSVSKYLVRYRSYMTLIRGVEYVPNKLSSMGNGFTFEVMSALLLSLARTLDDTSRVYGDDVIIHNLVSSEFISACEDIGFFVNAKKTFTFSHFRESCGAFYLDGHGYLVTYDYKWISDDLDFIITCNKLSIALAATNDPRLLSIYKSTLRSLLTQAPSSMLGPDISSVIADSYKAGNSVAQFAPYCDSPSEYAVNRFMFDTYIFCKDWKKKQISEKYYNPESRRFKKGKECASLYGYKPYEVSHIIAYKKQNKQVSPAIKDIKHDPFRIAAYFYSLRRSKDEDRNSFRLVSYAAIVTPSGAVIPLTTLS